MNEIELFELFPASPHRKNRTHLHRMVVDVRYMRDKLKALREQIEEAQYRKFGCIVDTTELEQALLKRFIWDMRSSADEIRAEFQGLIKSIQVSSWRKGNQPHWVKIVSICIPGNMVCKD